MSLVSRILADLIVIVHAAYVLFVVLALPVILLGAWPGWGWVRNPVFRYTHLTMILVVVAEAWAGISLPADDMGEMAAALGRRRVVPGGLHCQSGA